MLDVPKLGLELLADATTAFAASTDDADEYEMGMEILDTARKLVGRTELRRGIRATSKGSEDQQKREKDVMLALTHASEVRRME